MTPAQGLIIHQPQQRDTQQEAISGEVYTVYSFTVKAQSITSGRYDLTPAIQAQLASRRKQPSPFDEGIFAGFFGGAQTEPHDLAVQPLALIVNDLPAEGRPASFSGAVGQFTFEMTGKPLELTAGDPVTLDFRIAGHGNIDSAQMPPLSSGEQFKVYEAKLTGQNANEQNATGEKTFEQVIIPKSETARMIPEIAFSFFDPEKRAYQTVTRGPVQLVVHAAAKEKQSLIVENSGTPLEKQNKTSILGADIVYLKSAPREFLHTDETAWFEKPFALAVQSVPALVVLATFVLVRRREMVAGDVVKSRRQLAPKTARAGIARARIALAANDANQFYEALWDAMSSYFGHRLNLAPGDVSADRIDVAFVRANFDGAQRELVKNLFASCEQSRFGGAPRLDSAHAEKLIAELGDALRACEKINI